ncbi:acyl-CoA thioesterase domain-containing protein [Geodermatophilus sp. DSM 44513]|uniref:acyl-CoA thioesterase n=1 Tax=Geodermatophilus sp. DSM 44513 TaxID=1528104 RepID=UPI00127E25DD|nr:acyl-CoA thioesterase domain-containing protein [Geodermatophilus sp. DSM 44513]WNV77062.1 thioesterase family protein [Geodermatophilus sp. DSM 44513]
MTGSPGDAPTSAAFTAAITLDERPARHHDVAYAATTQPCPWPKAYGGDLVAAAAAAAMRTVPEAGEGGKSLHSMHSYFMRPADIGAEVLYEVELLRDGRAYSTRHVRGYQNGKPVYVALASFATGEPGDSYSPQPPAVPAPETLPTSAKYLADRSGGTMTAESKAYWSGGRSFDMRHVPGPVYLTVEGDRAPHQAVWFRPHDRLREVPGLSRAQRDTAALAYVCDYTILEPVLRVLGLAWARPGLVTASLDHAMWFHRVPGDGVLDDWLLYAQEAGHAGSGRGVGTGRISTRDGQLLATVVQEGMTRVS